MTTADDCHDIFDAMCSGDIAQLEAYAEQASDGFPHGTDGWMGRHWVTHAVDSANLTSLAWVLSHKPDVTFIDDEGFTALKSALQVEHDGPFKMIGGGDDLPPATLTCRIVDLLLEAGADINQRMLFDATALHTAARWSSATVVRHLLDRGADPLAIESDFEPETPADIAKRHGKPGVYDILRRAEAAARS